MPPNGTRMKQSTAVLLGTRDVNCLTLEQWQYEVTAGGRLWYCIHDDRKIVWLMDAMVGHPKPTG